MSSWWRTVERVTRCRIGSRVIELVENGVDFSIWRQSPVEKQRSDLTKFIFVGRLIDWKALDIVFQAMRQLNGQVPVSLEIIGDGPMRANWQSLVDRWD